MKISRILVKWSLSLCSLSAMADGQIVNYGNGVFGPPGCNESSQVKTWRELLQQVNIGEFDRRGGIESLGAKLGLSPAEKLRIRQTTGYIRCPGTDLNNGAVASGAMVGDGGQIVTNVHAFLDENLNPRGPLTNCYFLNQEVPNPKMVMLDFSPGAFSFYTENPYKDGANDMARVKLKNEVKDPKVPGGSRKIISATPFKIDVSGKEITQDAAVILVSASQLRMQKPVDPGEPIVQLCAIQKVFPTTANHPTLFLSDCSSTQRASGSIALVRNSDGELVNIGIAAAGGNPDRDHVPFSVAGKSYTIHLGLDGLTPAQLAQLQDKKPNP